MDKNKNINIKLRFDGIHKNKYSYENFIYTNAHTKSEIMCYTHGIFQQTPANHLKGHGCPECGKIQRAKSKTKSKEQFIEDAKTIHGNIYDYSLVEYNRNDVKVKIICSVHGYFTQRPGDHLQGNGCPVCSGNSRITIDEFIKRANEAHDFKYNYSEVQYKNAQTKVDVICPIHGIFSCTPHNHINNTSGCPSCSGNRRNNTEQFTVRAKYIHSNKYDYSLVEYKNNSTKINIICPIHGIFQQTPSGHLKSSGCPECANELTLYSKYKDNKTTLYYIKINNHYKIGLTRTSVIKRFKKEIDSGVQIEIIKQIEFEDGWEAFLLEQKVLNETKHLKILKDESPIKGGWTEIRKECFLEFIIKKEKK